MKKTIHIYIDLDTSNQDEILFDLLLKLIPRKQRKKIIKKVLLSTLLDENFIEKNLKEDEANLIKTLKNYTNNQKKDLLPKMEKEAQEELIKDDIIDLDKTIEKIKNKKTDTEAEIKFKY